MGPGDAPDQGSGQLRSTLEYLADEGAERLVLEPLSPAAVAQMASDVMRAEPDETLLQMAGEAGGNPFLLVELLEGLREEKLVRVDSGQATLTDYRLPDRVSTSMRERLARHVRSAASGRHGRRIAGANVFSLRAGGDARRRTRFAPGLRSSS